MTVPDPICTPGKPHVVIDMEGNNLGLATRENERVVQTGEGKDAKFYFKRNVWIMDADAYGKQQY